MSAASFLKQIGTATSGYMNFDSLEQGTPYKVLSFSAYKSKAFEKERNCVRVHIDDGYLILPERYDGCYNRLKTLNIDNLYIVYKGRKGKGNRLEIDFEEIDDSVADDDDDEKNNKNKKSIKNKRKRLE